MSRYLRLYRQFLSFSFARALHFRLDFFFRIFMDLNYYLMNILFYRVIFLSTASIGGWTEPQVIIFVASFCVVDALNMTLFANNVWQLGQLINRGDLDYYLVRPVSSLFFLSLRDFAANSFVNLLCALGILAWALARYPEPLSFGRLLLFSFMLLNGVFLYYLVSILFILPTFWTHSGLGFTSIAHALVRCMERPDTIFRGWFRKILLTVLPYSLMASFPARILTEARPGPLVFHCLLVSATLFAMVLLLWARALRSYSSASS